MNRYGDLDDWKAATIRPYKAEYLNLEIDARKAEEQADPVSANFYRMKARALAKHIRRLEKL
jgi:hypothetical protein